MNQTSTLGTIAAVALGTGGALVFVMEVPMQPAGVLIFGLISAAVVWTAVRLAKRADAYFRVHDLCSPLVAFPFLYIVWFTLGSLNVPEDSPITKIPAFAAIPGRQWWLYGAGLLGYVLGVWVTKGVKTSRALVPVQRFWNPWTRGGFKEVMGVLFVLVIVSWAFLILQMGITVLTGDAVESRVQISGHGFVSTIFFCSAWTLFPLMLCWMWTKPQSEHSRRWSYLGILMVSSLLISLGSRTPIFVPVLVSIIAAHYLRKRLSVLQMVAVLLIVFVAVGVFGYFREYLYWQSSGLDLFAEVGVPGFLVPVTHAYLYVRQTIVTFSGITQIIPNEVPYQLGWTTLVPLTVPLPGTQETADMFFKQILGLDFIGFGAPAGILGTFYADFGVAGILAGMFTLGWLMQKSYAKLLRERSVLSVLTYAWMSHICIFGLFVGAFPWLSHAWIPIQLWMLDGWMRRRAVAPQSAGAAGAGFGSGLQFKPGPHGAMPN